MYHAPALRAPRLCALALLAIASFFATFAQAAAPRIYGTPPTSVVVGLGYYFKPTASDSDGNTLTFSIANKPGWASFSTSTGTLSGAPYSNHVGTYSGITISVSDGTTRVSLPAFSIVVRANSNQSPVVSGTPVTTAKVGTAYAFQPSGRDPEGKALIWSVRNKPSWATFSGSTGRLSGTPTTTGTYSSIIITASDGVTITALPTFSITVSGTSTTTNSAPTITGTPSLSARVGQAYSFVPTARDANGDPLTFSIANKPSWATFSTTTGQLAGTPSATGTFSGITIGVTDGKSTAVKLAPFAITVSSATSGGTGSASLRWTPPTRNTDGSTLTNLAGYKILYGTSASSLSKTITVANPGVSSYVVDNLASGTWYFTLKAYTTTGTESASSTVGSKSIP